MLRLSFLLTFLTTVYSQCTDPNCIACDPMDPNLCTYCGFITITQYTLYGTACYSCPLNLNCNVCNATSTCYQCGLGYTNYGTVCYGCGPGKVSQCATCMASSTNCPGCGGQATYFYINQCVSTCPAGTYTDTANL